MARLGICDRQTDNYW